jgi:hypothetical protein
MIEESTK